jgi:hypothetical protein
MTSPEHHFHSRCVDGLNLIYFRLYADVSPLFERFTIFLSIFIVARLFVRQ